MKQILHRCATTTEEIRNKIKLEKGTIDSIAKKYNISWNTAKKWQSRDNVADKPMGNDRSNSALSTSEDWLICEVRRLIWLPLDDLHQILKPMLPKRSRSGLHRLLQYYGIGKKPKELQQKPQRSKFKSYEIGYLHIDITDFWLHKKKWSLFVAIDQETKFTNVYKFYPYKIHTIRTDNGLQFSDRALKKSLKPNKTHPFDKGL